MALQRDFKVQAGVHSVLSKSKQISPVYYMARSRIR
jgi:hypothetical protein